MPLIINNLYHTYNMGMPTETSALRGISLHANSGEILSIVGHTGCGKSTLARHMNGLILPQRGEVFVDGIKISCDTQELRKIREKVGLVFQYPEQQIFAETVEEEISFGPSNWGLKGEELDSRIRFSMHLMGLDISLLKHNPFELSGGQKRRVAIASVLASDPSYLVLDEPTAGLDASGVKELIDILKERVQSGKSVIHITHDLELALKISNRILVLAKGGTVVCGTPFETASALCVEDVDGLAMPDVLRLSCELKKEGKIGRITWDPYELAEIIAGRR